MSVITKKMIEEAAKKLNKNSVQPQTTVVSPLEYRTLTRLSLYHEGRISEDELRFMIDNDVDFEDLAKELKKRNSPLYKAINQDR